MRVDDETISSFNASALGRFSAFAPWEITARSSEFVTLLLTELPDGFKLHGSVAIHATTTVEEGAVIKGPAIIGPHCFLAAGGYVRDGCWIDSNCILGPGAELKSSFVFAGSKLAHFNFVGDSILGHGINIEAGAIIANYRNESTEPEIILQYKGERIVTGALKFGALVGDKTRIGANAVIAPGAILQPNSVVERLALVDQSVPANFS